MRVSIHPSKHFLIDLRRYLALQEEELAVFGGSITEESVLRTVVTAPPATGATSLSHISSTSFLLTKLCVVRVVRVSCRRERLTSYGEQIEDMRKQRYVLLKKNSELKEKNEELARSNDHMKKNNADLRKQNETLRDRVDELEKSATSRRSSTSSSRDKPPSGDKKEVKTEPGTTPTPTPTATPTLAIEPQAQQTAAAKIAELEKATGDLLQKNLDLVRKNIDLIQRFKESQSTNMALESALAEANKVPTHARTRASESLMYCRVNRTLCISCVSCVSCRVVCCCKAVEDLRNRCDGLQAKMSEMEEEEVRRKSEKVEKKMKKLEQQLAAENNGPSGAAAAAQPAVTALAGGNPTAATAAATSTTAVTRTNADGAPEATTAQ